MSTTTPLRARAADLHLGPSAMSAQRGEVPSLDGIRAASVIVVMCGHFIDSELFPGGFGVLVFFVISGFLITRLLLAEFKARQRIGLFNFYVRRLLRLYPVILVYVGVIFAVAEVNHLPFFTGEITSTLLYYSNYYLLLDPAMAQERLPLQIFWSLAIEEHFYVVFPVLLILLRGKAERLIVAMAAVMLLAVALRLWIAHSHPDYLTTPYFYRRSELRMDSIATGVLMAVLCERPTGRALLRRAADPIVAAVALGTLLTCFLLRDPWFRETLRYSILNCCVAVMIAAVLFSDRYRPVNVLLNLPGIVWIGRLSYSLYVWHLGVVFVLPMERIAFWPRVAALFALSFGTAWISYRLIERPFLALRHRFGSVRTDEGRTLAPEGRGEGRGGGADPAGRVPIRL